MSSERHCILAFARALPGCLDDLLAVFSPLIEATRSEPGCQRYELWQDAVNSRGFVVLQEWSSAEELEAHLGSALVEAVGVRLGGLVDGSPNVMRFRKLL